MAFSLDQFYRLNRRALIWIIMFVLIWLMRDFFGLIFLTFTLAFISTPLAKLAQRYLRLSRRMSIVAVYGCFLLALVSFANYVTPRAIKEANILINSLPQTVEKIVSLKNSLIKEHPSLDPLIMGYIRSGLPDDDASKSADSTGGAAPATALARPVAPEAPGLTLSLKMNFGPHAAPGQPGAAAGPARATQAGRDAGPKAGASPAPGKIRQDEMLVQSFMNMMADKLREQVPVLIKLLWKASGTALLALLFSFLITLDISRLSQELKSLRASRLHEFYEQAAQPVVRFAYVLGRSFQAQSAIACANAILTMTGLLLLGIPSVVMLSLIIFVCSFIPVLGVFISTIPIVLVALNSGGLSKAVVAIVLVMVIHAVEAYFLNPLIYGKHLKLNPVLVLIILFVGHHAFGVWGMLLGVPVAYYFIHDVFGVPVWGERVLSTPAHPLGGMPRTGSAEQPGHRDHDQDRAVRVGEESGKDG